MLYDVIVHLRKYDVKKILVFFGKKDYIVKKES